MWHGVHWHVAVLASFEIRGEQRGFHVYLNSAGFPSKTSVVGYVRHSGIRLRYLTFVQDKTAYSQSTPRLWT
jgi:hypothetical protein